MVRWLRWHCPPDRGFEIRALAIWGRERYIGHGSSPQYWFSHVDGEETFFVSFKPLRPGIEPRTLVWKAAVLTITLGPPPTKCQTGIPSKKSHAFILRRFTSVILSVGCHLASNHNIPLYLISNTSLLKLIPREPVFYFMDGHGTISPGCCLSRSLLWCPEMANSSNRSLEK